MRNTVRPEVPIDGVIGGYVDFLMNATSLSWILAWPGGSYPTTALHRINEGIHHVATNASLFGFMKTTLRVKGWYSAMADWTGLGYSTEWTDKKNWKPEHVPGKDDDVIVSKAETSYNRASVPAGTKVKRLTLSVPAGLPDGGGLEGAPLSVTKQFTWLGGDLDAGLDAQTDIAQVLISGSPSKTNPPSLGGVESAGLKMKDARLENATRALGYGVHISHSGRLESYGESMLMWSGGEQPFLITPQGGVLFVGSTMLTVDDVILRVTGIVELAKDGVLSLEGRDGLHFLDKGARVVGSGKIRVCNGGRLLAVESALVETGATLELADGGMIEDLPPGKLPYPVLGPIQEKQLLRVDGTLLWTGGNIQGAVVVDPDGMLETQGTGDKLVSLGPLRILGAAHLFGPGPVKVDGGELRNEGKVVLHDGMSVILSRNPLAFTQTAGVLRIAPKAVLRCDNPLTLRGGRLEGNGRIVGDVVQYGTTSPGDLKSTGILTVDGNYMQTPDARLEVRIRGPRPGSGYDQLAVTGRVSLDGELRVTVAGYQPKLGTRFAIVKGALVRWATSFWTKPEYDLYPVWKTDRLELLVGRNLSAWSDLISFRPPEAIQNVVKTKIDWGVESCVHAVERGKGPINIDYYPVKITKMPTIAGVLATPEIFLRHIRLHLNKMVDTNLAEFTPFDPIEETKWISATPLGAIIHIDMAPGGGNPDDGSVVTSSVTPRSWTFSTIWISSDQGHPVSGNRMFGYTDNGDGTYTFYTRGADRPTSNLDVDMQEIIFASTHRLWQSFQTGVATYVNALEQDGTAVIEQSVSERYDWPTTQSKYWKPRVDWALGAACE